MWWTDRAVGIWVGLVGFCGLLLFLFGMLVNAQRRREEIAEGLPSRQDVAQLETVAAVAFEEAQQAAVDAEVAEEEVVRAEAERDRAWQEHSALTEAVDRLGAELAALPVEATLPDPEQREVSRAARDAFRRGELSMDELRAVWRRLDGWGQTLEDRARELSRLRAETAEAWRRYHQASVAERSAHLACDTAQAAARRLREEAADAAREAQLAQLRRRR